MQSCATRQPLLPAATYNVVLINLHRVQEKLIYYKKEARALSRQNRGDRPDWWMMDDGLAMANSIEGPPTLSAEGSMIEVPKAPKCMGPSPADYLGSVVSSASGVWGRSPGLGQSLSRSCFFSFCGAMKYILRSQNAWSRRFACKLWGSCMVNEPRGPKYWGREPLWPHKVGPYGWFWKKKKKIYS